ncbi:MAG: DNA methyltransferase [Minicystis sp.]
MLRERRALSHVGGPARLTGDRAVAEQLAEAIDVPSSEASAESEALARAHVHGFHSYPARMHPLAAHRLIEAFSAPGERVLDPFCGSGTVLVEARLAGRASVGVDANPLAVRLARLKVRGLGVEERARLLEAAATVAASADARRKARVGATHRYGPDDVALFQPHVLLELDGIRAGIDALPEAATRGDLELVLSAILIKLSRKSADTSEQGVEKRIAAGYPARLFVRKTEELCRNLDSIAATLAQAPPARVLEGDARHLEGIAEGSVQLALTSPPYPGNYDYLAHHAARLRWLRLRPERFDQAEIGARRHLEPLGEDEGRLRFADELGAVLSAVGRALAPGAPFILLIADSVVSGAPIFALDLLAELAAPAGFAPVAAASQLRPHFHAPTGRAFQHRPREEHAALLARLPSRTAGPRVPARKLAR